MMLKKSYLFVAFASIYKSSCANLIRGYLWTCADSVNAMLMIAVFAIIGAGPSDVYHTNRIYVIGMGLWVMASISRAYFGTAHGTLFLKMERVLENYIMSPLPAWLWIVSVITEEIQASLFANWPVVLLLFIMGMSAPSWQGALLGMALLLLAMVFFVCMGFMMSLTAQKWNDLSKWDNTIIFPAFMLSGSFFDASALPEKFRFLMEYNPIYQLQYGVRQLWFLNENPIPYNFIVWGAMAGAMFIINWFVLYRGFGLKR
ncbi:MAG: ABC transporter permease [Hydrotalea sp.]|nr:ABC transporter permease [Hydrotalea sp.]